MKIFAPNTDGYEILTPNGWRPFAGISMMGENKIHYVTFSDDSEVKCSPTHGFLTENKNIINASELLVGTKIISLCGVVSVIANVLSEDIKPTYSPIEVEDDHIYFTNGIASKNCEFVTDDETLIHPMCLARLKSRNPEFYIGTSRWYREPEANKTYLVALDPSGGTSNDYAAIEVFQLPEMI